MKRNIGLLLVAIMFFVGIGEVSATCDAVENNKLTGLAVNVNVTYEEAEGELDSSEYSPPDGVTEEEADNYTVKYTYFKIYITNLTEDLYVVVNNSVTGSSTTYNYSDSENGTITFNWDDILNITNLTVTVYSSGNTNCAGSKLRTIYKTLPRYNQLSSSELCEGNEDFYLCHRYLSINAVDFDEFVTLINKYESGKVNNDGQEIIEPENPESGFQKFIRENKVAIIIVGVSIIAVGATTIVILVKRQRSRIV